MYPSPDTFRAFATERQNRFQAQAARAHAARLARSARREVRQQVRRADSRRFAPRNGTARAPARG